jgi:hypothetical protein
LLNSVARIVGRFKSNNSGALGATGGVGMNIGTDYGALLSYVAEDGQYQNVLRLLKRGRRQETAAAGRHKPDTWAYLLGGKDPSNLASQR